MALGDLLPRFLQRSDDSDDGVLRECRHCGAKFDEPVDRCRVCEATEIATYEFVTVSSDTDESVGVEGQPTGSREGEDGSNARGDETIEEDGDSEREPEPEPEPDRGDHEDRPDGEPAPEPERDDRS
ncbi:hypothetical protein CHINAEXTREME_01315 [Halobiforma lacisalsi AJ5]|nr:hypothetical protein [Halobiforma lacisalsi]APW96486.1 hypothetical protein CHINAEXTREME_01315 [Halobiforma lacisalsi AJ5]